MPFGPGLSCFAPSPGGAVSRPLRASIPIAGAPSASCRCKRYELPTFLSST